MRRSHRRLGLVVILVSALFAGTVATPADAASPSPAATASTAAPASSNTGPHPVPAATLTGPSWSASSSLAGATGVSYTYKFTTASLLNLALTSVTMTVPPGTTGTPVVGSVSPSAFAGGTVSLSGTTLTYSKNVGIVLTGTSVSIQLTGLTNTPTAGSYTSTITTHSNGTTLDSGTTPALTLTGTLSATAPSSLTWATTLTGGDQLLVDSRASDQQLSVDDNSGTWNGWHLTVAATPLTTGTHALPATGTLVATGSLTSVASTSAPTASCVSTCTLPTNSVTYPVAVPTTTTPTAVTVYSAASGTGRGQILLGGSSAANPLGWWVKLPANAYTGSYTTTMTISTVSGP